jgi:hypothetical protein
LIEHLEYFRIEDNISNPSKQDISKILYSLGKKRNGVYSYLWNNNIIIGISDNQFKSNETIAL